MASFMIFITGLGTVMIMRHEDDALIEPGYYEKGQAYELDFQAMQMALNDSVTPIISHHAGGLSISFPVPVKFTLICRRNSDENMDRTFNGNSDKENTIQIHDGDLEPGRWLLRIEYTANGKKYLYKGEILIP